MAPGELETAGEQEYASLCAVQVWPLSLSSSGQARLAGPNKHSAGPGCWASRAAPGQRLLSTRAGGGQGAGKHSGSKPCFQLFGRLCCNAFCRVNWPQEPSALGNEILVRRHPCPTAEGDRGCEASAPRWIGANEQTGSDDVSTRRYHDSLPDAPRQFSAAGVRADGTR